MNASRQFNAVAARPVLFLLVLAFLACAPGLWTLPVLDRDEARYAQATVQMAETGDYVRINFQDQPRHKKPVGIHWLQAAVTGPTGAAEARAIWVFRLPSLISAVLAVLACYWAGLALLQRREALAGAALFAVTPMLSVEASIAKTDAALVLFTTLALGALAWLLRRGAIEGDWTDMAERADTHAAQSPARLAFIFWAALGAGVLIKGPITPMVAVAAAVAASIALGGWRWLRPLADWRAIAVCLLIVLPWSLAVGFATDWDFYRDAISEDLGPKLHSGDEGHSGPPLYHLVASLVIAAPIWAGLPLGAARALRERGRALWPWFLAAWALPSWLIFEALPTKLPHYTLPLYPALALMAGAGLMELLDARRGEPGRPLLRAAGAGVCALAFAALALLVWMAVRDYGGPTRGWPTAYALFAAAAALAVIAAATFSRGRFLWSAAVATCLLVVVGLLGVTPALLTKVGLSDRVSEAMIEAGVHPRLSGRQTGAYFAVGDVSEPSLVFLTRTDLRLREPEAAISEAGDGDVIIASGEALGALDAAARAKGLALHQLFEVEGVNYNRGPELIVVKGLKVAAIRNPPDGAPEPPPGLEGG